MSTPTLEADTERFWFTLNRQGKVAGVQRLTDERALEQILRGARITPVGGQDKLLATIASELEGASPC